MTGTLKDWSVIPKLGNLSCPTLIINGADDEVRNSCVAPLFYGIKKAKWITLGSSSYMPFWEEPEKYFDILGNFFADSGLENEADVGGLTRLFPTYATTHTRLSLHKYRIVGFGLTSLLKYVFES